MRQLGLAATERPNSLHPLAHPQQTQPRPLALPPARYPGNSQPLHPLSLKAWNAFTVRTLPMLVLRRGNQRLVQPRQNGTQTRTGQSGSQAAAPDSITTSGLCSGRQCLSKTPSCLPPLLQAQGSRPFGTDVASEGSEAWSRRPRATWWPGQQMGGWLRTPTPPKPGLASLRTWVTWVPPNSKFHKREGGSTQSTDFGKERALAFICGFGAGTGWS